MKLTTLLTAGALALAPLSAIAAPWALDKSHTHISFTVNHLGFSNTFGTFRDFDAEIDFDPDNIEASSVSFSIDASSVDTFFAARDEHVRNTDFLNVGEHPSITFVSTSVAKTGDNTADLTGDLTILGTTQSVTFKAVMNNMGPNPFAPDVTVAGFEITGEVNRSDFGMGFGVPAIGEIVPVTISLEISPK